VVMLAYHSSFPRGFLLFNQSFDFKNGVVFFLFIL